MQSEKDDTPLILVVDDEPINIEILCMMMAAKGYANTDNALEGAKALELVINRLENGGPMYRLILLDFSMPNMDGPSVARAIRNLWKT